MAEWIKPTGYNDPDNKWTYEECAYDDNSGTYAITLPIEKQSWGSFLELTINSTSCSKIRFNPHQKSEITYVCVDIYYNSAWHNLYGATPNWDVWNEISLGGYYYVTKMRFKFYNWSTTCANTANLNEAEFYYDPIIIPSVFTQSTLYIFSTIATGRGNITDFGKERASKRGVCWNTTGNPTIADSKSEEIGSFGTGAFTRLMTGLSPGTLYYVKAYACNSAGYGYGNQRSFTTRKAVPIVTTQYPTDVLSTTVTANGNITVLCGENATVRGFKYDLTRNEINPLDKHSDGSFGLGAFTESLTGLTANTTYWIRAYATNSIGTGYGAWIQFQTVAAGTTPTGTKISICSDYLGYTYILNESLTDDGNAYESYFVISTDLAEKQGLHFKKRLEDLYSYFEKKDSGTCKIYVKRDNETTWQYAGEISMVGDEDIIIKHLPSENQDTSGDVDFAAKHFLIKFVFQNDFEFIGLVAESILIGVR